MKILIDENIPLMTLRHLREQGHDVKDIRRTAVQGLTDTDLWSLAMDEERLVITTDKGFTAFRRSRHHGILVVRLRQPNRAKIHQAVVRAMDEFEPPEWGAMLVVMRDRTMSVSRA